jgi:Hemerythrin HHE cation binding domain
MQDSQDPKQVETARSLFEEWGREDSQLADQFSEMRRWMLEAAGSAHPRFAETGDRLNAFRDVLAAHFAHEDELCEKISTFYERPCIEADGLCRQTVHDHKQLLDRLDSLVSDLKSNPSSFASWEAAVDQVSLFMDAVELHSEQEAESLQSLMPLPSSE